MSANAGDVLWLGQNLVNTSPKALRKTRQSIHMIFQDPLASINPRLTIADIIAEPLRAF